MVLFPSGSSGSREQKRLAVLKMKAEGRKTVFIGDGASDLAAALVSEIVFARASLLDSCLADGIPCAEFRDFHDILRHLEDGRSI